jgi:hypothetical protein
LLRIELIEGLGCRELAAFFENALIVHEMAANQLIMRDLFQYCSLCRSHWIWGIGYWGVGALGEADGGAGGDGAVEVCASGAGSVSGGTATADSGMMRMDDPRRW